MHRFGQSSNNADGRLVKYYKVFAVFPDSFLKGLLIKDDIACVGMNCLDKGQEKQNPLAAAVVDTKTGGMENFISIPGFNIFGQRNVADKSWTKYEILQADKFP